MIQVYPVITLSRQELRLSGHARIAEEAFREGEVGVRGTELVRLQLVIGPC